MYRNVCYVLSGSAIKTSWIWGRKVNGEKNDVFQLVCVMMLLCWFNFNHCYCPEAINLLFYAPLFLHCHWFSVHGYGWLERNGRKNYVAFSGMKSNSTNIKFVKRLKKRWEEKAEKNKVEKD